MSSQWSVIRKGRKPELRHFGKTNIYLGWKMARELVYDTNMKYRKVLTKEGTTIDQTVQLTEMATD
jgi:hypothetical protein